MSRLIIQPGISPSCMPPSIIPPGIPSPHMRPHIGQRPIVKNPIAATSASASRVTSTPMRIPAPTTIPLRLFCSANLLLPVRSRADNRESHDGEGCRRHDNPLQEWRQSDSGDGRHRVVVVPSPDRERPPLEGDRYGQAHNDPDD